VRWAQELAGYDFKIIYQPESQNRKPDTSSRCSEYRPKKGGMAEDNKNQPIAIVLWLENFGHNDLEYDEGGISIISVA
jgi:hypothetical protein